MRGPNPKRFYSQWNKRWQVLEGASGSNEIAILQRNSLTGKEQFRAAILIPIVGCILGAAASFATGQISILCAAVPCAAIPGLVIWFYASAEKRISENLPLKPLVVLLDGSCVVNDAKFRTTTSDTCTLVYNYIPSNGGQGASDFSEFNLSVTCDGLERIIELMATQNDWCLKHAKKISQLSGLPLTKKRVAG